MLVEAFNDEMGIPNDSEVRDEMDKSRQPISRPNRKKNEETKTCNYCGRADKNFLDTRKYDMHLWKECPMLTTCKECALVVEIETLTDHLLEECENSAKYQEVNFYL